MELSHMDEFIDELLREDRACDVILPRIQVTLTLTHCPELQVLLAFIIQWNLNVKGWANWFVINIGNLIT